MVSPVYEGAARLMDGRRMVEGVWSVQVRVELNSGTLARNLEVLDDSLQALLPNRKVEPLFVISQKEIRYSAGGKGLCPIPRLSSRSPSEFFFSLERG